jgi:alkyldihydroxyacetonephosphate synthase
VPAKWAIDWWPINQKRRQWGRQVPEPMLVLSPHNHDELARLLGRLAELDVPITPYGLGSSVVGGAAATTGAVTVETTRMCEVLELDEVALTVTVQAGMRGSDLESFLNERGLTCGHYPQSLALSTVGGWVATRATGTFSLKYGGIEQLVLGLRWVSPAGESFAINAVPRRSAGPDLRGLVLGSEGMLGIISEVTLQVFRQPAARRFDAYMFPDTTTGLHAVRELVHADLAPSLVRLYDHADAARFGLSETPAPTDSLLILAWDGNPQLIDLQQTLTADVLTSHGGRHLGAAPAERWFQHRFDVSALEGAIAGDGTIGDTIEIAFPWSRVDDAYRDVMDVFHARGVRANGHFSHVYHSGTSLYIVFFLGPDTEEALEDLYAAVWNEVMERTLRHGGTISHHHGIGRARGGWIARELSGTYVMLQRIRDLVDPGRRFNHDLFVEP